MRKAIVCRILALLIGLFASGQLHAQADGPTEPRRALLALGDSLAAAGYADLVGQHFGVRVTNAGLGGQSAVQVAARYGAAATVVVVENDRLVPGANVLTTIAPELLRSSNREARSTRASIAGITGLLTRSVLTDRRECNIFVPDPGQRLPRLVTRGSQLIVDTGTMRDDVLLLSVGRNGGIADPARLKAQVAAILSTYRPTERRIILLGIPNSANEPRGSDAYGRIVALNHELAALYPDLFLDIRAAYNGGSDHRLPQDRADRARDVPPRSLRADDIHYNDRGRRIWADAVIAFIHRKGWFGG